MELDSLYQRFDSLTFIFGMIKGSLLIVGMFGFVELLLRKDGLGVLLLSGALFGAFAYAHGWQMITFMGA